MASQILVVGIWQIFRGHGSLYSLVEICDSIKLLDFLSIHRMRFLTRGPHCQSLLEHVYKYCENNPNIKCVCV
jgi:hypothetical protein